MPKTSFTVKSATRKALELERINRVNAEFGIDPYLPPAAHKRNSAKLDGSGSVVAAGGPSSFQSICIVLSGEAVRRQWPFMAFAAAAGGHSEAPAAASAGLQTIPDGNHGDNLRSAQK